MDIIFDIDGTLADITHRRPHVAAKPKNWPRFQELAHLDTPHEPIATLARSLFGQHRIILCSGRGEQEREVTEAWLAKYDIHFNALYMRAEKDYRADDVVKEELLDRILADGFSPALVFDDRKRVVEMWRRRGLMCAQVADGDF
jgi:phosphoglycolate phosphatase-like HAD superfamily hydrolase